MGDEERGRSGPAPRGSAHKRLEVLALDEAIRRGGYIGSAGALTDPFSPGAADEAVSDLQVAAAFDLSRGTVPRDDAMRLEGVLERCLTGAAADDADDGTDRRLQPSFVASVLDALDSDPRLTRMSASLEGRGRCGEHRLVECVLSHGRSALVARAAIPELKRSRTANVDEPEVASFLNYRLSIAFRKLGLHAQAAFAAAEVRDAAAAGGRFQSIVLNLRHLDVPQLLHGCTGFRRDLAADTVRLARSFEDMCGVAADATSPARVGDAARLSIVASALLGMIQSRGVIAAATEGDALAALGRVEEYGRSVQTITRVAGFGEAGASLFKHAYWELARIAPYALLNGWVEAFDRIASTYLGGFYPGDPVHDDQHRRFLAAQGGHAAEPNHVQMVMAMAVRREIAGRDGARCRIACCRRGAGRRRPQRDPRPGVGGAPDGAWAPAVHVPSDTHAATHGGAADAKLRGDAATRLTTTPPSTPRGPRASRPGTWSTPGDRRDVGPLAWGSQPGSLRADPPQIDPGHRKRVATSPRRASLPGAGGEVTVQLVFVHGVATRADPDPAAYDAQVAERHAWFRDVSLKGADVRFHDPYWGDEGTSAGKSFLSIPLGPGVPLGLGGSASRSASGGGAGTLGGSDLLEAARVDLDGVLNSLALELADSGSPDDVRLSIALGAYAAARDDAAGPAGPPAWLTDGSVRSDEELLSRLRQEAGASAATTGLSLGDALRAAGRRLVGSAVGVVDGPIERMARRLSPQIGIFLGDVFTYLREGAHRSAIRGKVAAGLAAGAAAARDGGGPLVVVGHSMGAIILHDMLNDPAALDDLADRIGAPLHVDLLLTVGTQVGLFQELALFDRDGLPAGTGRPAPAARWWHVYNVMDVLSFGVDGVFGEVEQFSVNTRANILDAHGAYFRSAVFHQRFRRRLRLAGLLA